jgi:di/tricarboxylate transporter
MTLEIGILFGIIGIAIVLFSIDRIPADLIALGILLSLILTRILTPLEAFAGFGSETFLMLLGLLLLTAALERTGVVDVLGRLILRRTGDNTQQLILIVMISAAFLSSMMSNTATAAFFLPMIISISRRIGIGVSKLLMPLAFAAILASSVTLIGTSTNLVVSGLMTQAGLSPLGMFELSPVGIPILIVGILYMLFIGQRLIPANLTPENVVDKFNSQIYLTEVMVMPDSFLVGKTLDDSNLGRDFDLNVVQVIRGEGQYINPEAELILREWDILLVEGKRDDILRVKGTQGIKILADVSFSDPELQSKDIRLVEAILLQRSPLLGHTLRETQFRSRYGLHVLGINRRGETIRHRISQVELRIGDILLVQGHRTNVAALDEDNTFQVIGSIEHNPKNPGKGWIAISIFLISIALTTFNILPFSVAVLLGALFVFITRSITPEEAYREVDWRILLLIGCMLSLGAALNSTGAAEYLAGKIVELFGHMNPIWLLSGFFFLTMLLTQPMSNQAAAVVVLPVAIYTATNMGLNPRPFAIMIALAASCSFMTPLEPACLMVYGPGGYRFVDFLKVGTLLTVAIFIVAIFLVPIIWPL